MWQLLHRCAKYTCAAGENWEDHPLGCRLKLRWSSPKQPALYRAPTSEAGPSPSEGATSPLKGGISSSEDEISSSGEEVSSFKAASISEETVTAEEVTRLFEATSSEEANNSLEEPSSSEEAASGLEEAPSFIESVWSNQMARLSVPSTRYFFIDRTREPAPCSPPPIWSARSLEIEREMLTDAAEWDARVAAEALAKQRASSSCEKRMRARSETVQAEQGQKKRRM
jgi:hypothetical protein